MTFEFLPDFDAFQATIDKRPEPFNEALRRPNAKLAIGVHVRVIRPVKGAGRLSRQTRRGTVSARLFALIDSTDKLAAALRQEARFFARRFTVKANSGKRIEGEFHG
jgi:hypothetical protein